MRQRGKVIIIFRQVRIVNRAIVFRHGKSGMSQQLLEGERIPAAVNQIFPRECVAEQVNNKKMRAAKRAALLPMGCNINSINKCGGEKQVSPAPIKKKFEF